MAPTDYQPQIEPGQILFGASIIAASRLSFTLIDLNGATGRRNGMASLALRRPNFRAFSRPAAALELVTGGDSEIHRPAILDLLHAMQQAFDLPPVRIEVTRGLPAHHGFGSKTTTLLAVAKLYCRQFGLTVETARLARLAARAGTSGASVNLIDCGGYLVDGGHHNPADFAADPHKYLLPSRFARPAAKPPRLINLPFPDWPILCMVTSGLELHGKPELDWFRATLPIPAEAAQRTAHHVLLNLSTSIAEADYVSFCRALNVLTYEHHYKQLQIEIQPPDVRKLFSDARQRADIDAICISVTGPMCYAFTHDAASALAWCAELQRDGVLKDFFFTNAQNEPCQFAAVPL